jgi:hypothetical protein
MKRATAAAGVLLLFGCDPHHEVEGPAGIAFSCADGRPARIFYEGGGDPARARARLLFDGHSFEMRAAPTLSGLRYSSESGLTPGSGLVWAAEGDEAVLIEMPADREIVRCTRIRDGTPPTDETHGEHDHH